MALLSVLQEYRIGWKQQSSQRYNNLTDKKDILKSTI